MSQVINFTGIEPKAEKGVLIVGANFATIGLAGPSEGNGRGGWSDLGGPCQQCLTANCLGKESSPIQIAPAKASVGLAISHVSKVWIVVVHAIDSQVRQAVPCTRSSSRSFHARAATGGDSLCFRPGSASSNRGTNLTVLLQMSEHLNLVIETFLCVWAVVGLYDPTVEGQAHRRAQRIFNFHTSLKIDLTSR